MKELKINVPDGYEIDKAKSTFENIVFKKKKGFPKSWEELDVISGFYVNSHSNEIICPRASCIRDTKNIFKTKEQAGAAIALAQLSQLRDIYRQGWEPNWNKDDVYRYCITFHLDKPYVVSSWEATSHFLSFQDKETAELFLENFKDLIEQAKPLMS